MKITIAQWCLALTLLPAMLACSSPTRLDTPRDVIESNGDREFTIVSTNFQVSESAIALIPFSCSWAGGMKLRRENGKMLLSIPEGSRCTVQPASAASSTFQYVDFVLSGLDIDAGVFMLDELPSSGNGARFSVTLGAPPLEVETTGSDAVRITPVHDADAKTIDLNMFITLTVAQVIGPPLNVDREALLSIVYSD